jgi:hypothetical protein
MSEEVVPSRSHLASYWKGWLSVLAVALAARILVFDAGDDRFPLAMTYMLGTWLPIMGLNLYEGRKLTSYMRERHPAKWEQITRVPGFGAGTNGFRLLPWLYSADTLGDPEVARRKSEYRSFIRFVLTVFCTYPIVIPLLSF